MKAIITKLIRVLTVAPLMALVTLITLYVYDKGLFDSRLSLLFISIAFLVVLPLLAYPLQPVIPHFKNKGREGQRNLAMIFAVSGYILGCITNLFLSAPTALWLIYLEYLLSGLLVLIINKAFHLRASAHACGIIGPAAMLAYFGIIAALPIGLVLYATALWASLEMKRHTVPQFIVGAIIPVAVLTVLHFIL